MSKATKVVDTNKYLAGEITSFQLDPNSKEIGSDIKCCLNRIFRKDKDICVQFGSEWFQTVMEKSSTSSLGFNYYGGGKKLSKTPRSYPRASESSIFIGAKVHSGDDKLGGRARIEPYSGESVGVLFEQLDNVTGESFALTDLMILYKRYFARKVLGTLKPGKNSLFCEINAAGSNPKNSALHDYPLLCIYLEKSNDSKDNEIQGRARLAQIFFTAVLNQQLLARKCSMEVVAREGFGAVFPSTSDLGTGIRLDPGFLPLIHVADVVATIALLENFMSAVALKKNELGKTITTLNGYGPDELREVDKRIFALSAMLPKILGACELGKFEEAITCMIKPDAVLSAPPQRTLAPCCYKISIPLKEMKVEENHKKDKEESGYGSESDEELDEDPNENVPTMVIRKAAFISGMAAIQIVNEVSRWYVADPENPVVLSPTSLVQPTDKKKELHAYYYFECLAMAENKGVAHYNVAPNPRNKIADVQKLSKEQVLTIDVTNATVYEKAELVANFIRECRRDKARVNHLLILEESGSKYPMGGDLVFGIIRCVGTVEATGRYFQLLQSHLDADKNKTSVLNEEEGQVRKRLNQYHVTSRNRDIGAACRDIMKGDGKSVKK